jgi:hypothetical protein
MQVPNGGAPLGLQPLLTHAESPAHNISCTLHLGAWAPPNTAGVTKVSPQCDQSLLLSLLLVFPNHQHSTADRPFGTGHKTQLCGSPLTRHAGASGALSCHSSSKGVLRTGVGGLFNSCLCYLACIMQNQEQQLTAATLLQGTSSKQTSDAQTHLASQGLLPLELRQLLCSLCGDCLLSSTAAVVT